MNAFQVSEVKSVQRPPRTEAARRTDVPRRRAIAFRSSRFDDSDSPGGLPDTAVAPCPSGSRARREYRGLRRDRMVPAAGRRRTPGDNTGPIETAAAPSRSGSTCRPAHRDRSRGRTAADGRAGGSGFPGPEISWAKGMLSFSGWAGTPNCSARATPAMLANIYRFLRRTRNLPAADLRSGNGHGGLYASISMLCVRSGRPACEIRTPFTSDVPAAAGVRPSEETITQWRLNGPSPAHSAWPRLASPRRENKRPPGGGL